MTRIDEINRGVRERRGAGGVPPAIELVDAMSDDPASDYAARLRREVSTIQARAKGQLSRLTLVLAVLLVASVRS